MKVTAIKQQVKRHDRYSVYVDGAYAFSLSENELLKQRLASGQELDSGRLKELKATSTADKAYGNALRYVAMRPRSTWEMGEYFRRKNIDEPVAATIMQRLNDLQLIDDLAFARSWVANRRLLTSSSKRKLQLELRQKRIDDDIVSQVLAEDDTDERQTLRELIAKKKARYADPTKLMHYLARQGFSYDDIKSVLADQV